MADAPELTALAAGLPATVPFVGPEAQERARGAPFAARLGANENGFGPSPRAIAAMADAAADAWMYGDPEAHVLRQALSAHHSSDPARIMPGEGIDGLLGLLVRLFVGPGDPVVTSAGTYPTFDYHVTGFGGRLHRVPYDGTGSDLSALADQARRTHAKLVYLANPDNPMGSWHSADAIQDFQASLPESCLLVLDEAYIDLAPDGTAPPISWQPGNLIRLRTFSKGYGLAGARVGYAIGPAQIIRQFDKVRNHFGLGRISQAGAVAALQDGDWLSNVQTLTVQSRQRIAQIARDNGLTALPSATNFVTIDCGRDGNFARALLGQLLGRGIFVRMPMIAPLDRCIRVGCGPDDAMTALASALPDAITAAHEELR